MVASSRGVKPRVPLAFVLLGSFSCNLYDPTLLNRRDATADIPRDAGADLGADLGPDRPGDAGVVFDATDAATT